MAKSSLPPGFRFHPTDLELVLYYLKRKIMGKPFRFEAISEIELYKFAPWDLPDKSCLQSKDLEWYFFCIGDKKYSNSLRKNRATDNGYWKTTGKDKAISYNSRIVAMKKTLVFHTGKVSRVRTDWVMHEYRLEDKEVADAGFLLDAYVLCRIFQKSGPGPKIGEQYGAPFKEEDWGNDEVNDLSSLVPPTCDGSTSVQRQFSDQALHCGISEVDSIQSTAPEYADVDILLKELSENNNNDISTAPYAEMPDSLIFYGASAEETAFSYGNRIYNGLKDFSSRVELKSADYTFVANNIEDLVLEHDLSDLSGQAEVKAIDSVLHHTQWGTDDGYMEMRDFQFPMEVQCPGPSVPDNLCGCHSGF